MSMIQNTNDQFQFESAEDLREEPEAGIVKSTVQPTAGNCRRIKGISNITDSGENRSGCY